MFPDAEWVWDGKWVPYARSVGKGGSEGEGLAMEGAIEGVKVRVRVSARVRGCRGGCGRGWG